MAVGASWVVACLDCFQHELIYGCGCELHIELRSEEEEE
jgi:hypothetical protein